MILPYRKYKIKKEINKNNKDLNKKTNIQLYTKVDSTNNLLKSQAKTGKKEGEIIIAYEQTSGRGRMDRKFYSPSGSGIYMSILLRPNILPKDNYLITTSAAVAVARALESFNSSEIGIKWVNDVFINNKKVGGILAESTPSINSEKFDYTILGIGLNLFEPEGGFPEDIKNIASSVFHDGDIKSKYIREQLAGKIISEFFEIYSKFPSKHFMNEYIQRSILIDKEVTITYGEQKFIGVVTKVDDNGQIYVKNTTGEEKHFSFGEARASLK